MVDVGLSHLIDRYPDLAAVSNWADVLSLGEQQRLGMARLFFHGPKFAVLDQVRDSVCMLCHRTAFSCPVLLPCVPNHVLSQRTHPFNLSTFHPFILSPFHPFDFC
jgi:hypothetical protein